ncbi:DUF2934 domain-containing protein [uncultured Methylobacterium sp.]|uniref:DUF2934 domain-containing protein n=1 Tax=uncultured Methylobacterium sp. TaxID=157278 RepID=UPI0035CBDEA6
MDLIEHRVRERAYYIWEDEGRVHGRADAHWLRAEAEVVAPAILTVQAVAEASLAPSPARTLKPKAARAAKAAVAAAPGEVAAKVAAKPQPKGATPKAPKALAAAGLAKAKGARASATAAGLH